MNKFMTKNEAIELMKGSTDAISWNQRREIVKGSVNPDERMEIIYFLDTSRLLHEVLKALSQQLNPKDDEKEKA